MNAFLLTIIIPHYNTPELLDRLISSIPNEQEIQIIVVDDNSMLFPNHIYEKYANNYNIELYKNYNKKNGAGICRNNGLEHALGKWILFADSDDYFLDGWYSFIKPYLFMDYEVMFMLPTSINLETGEKDTRHIDFEKTVRLYSVDPNHNNELHLRYNIPSCLCKLYLKDFLCKYHVSFGDTIVGEDAVFSDRVGRLMTSFVCITNKYVYCVTRRSGSLSTSMDSLKYYENNCVDIKKFGFRYRELSRKDIHELDLDYAGIRILYRGLFVEKSLRNTIDYLIKLKQEGVPLVNWKYFKLTYFLQQILRKVLN